MTADKTIPAIEWGTGNEIDIRVAEVAAVDTPVDGRGTRIVLRGNREVRVRQTEFEVKGRLGWI